MDSVSVGKSKSKVEVAPFYNEYHGLFGIDLTAEREEHRAWFEAKGAVNKSVANKELNEVRLRVLNHSAIKGSLYPPIGPPRIPTREKVMHREGSVILKENPRARTTESQSSLLRPTVPGDGVRVSKSGGRGDAVRVAFGSRPGIASSVTKLAKVNENEPKKVRKEKKSSNEFGSSNGSYEDGSVNTNNVDINNDLQSDSLIEKESSVQTEPREKKTPSSPIKPKPPASRAPKTTSSRVNNRGIPPSGNINKSANNEKTKDVVKPSAVSISNSEKTKGSSSSTSPRATKPAANNGNANDKNQSSSDVTPRPHPRKISTKTPKSSVSTQISNGLIGETRDPPSNPEVEHDGNNINDAGDDKEYYDDASFEEETLPFSAPSVLPPAPSQASLDYSFDEADAEAEEEVSKKTAPDHSGSKRADGTVTKRDLEESGYDDASFEEEPDPSPVKARVAVDAHPHPPTVSNNTTIVKTDHHNNNNNDNKKYLPKHDDDDDATTPSSAIKNHRSKALENLSDGSNESAQHNRDVKNKLKDSVDESYEEDYENDVDFNM